MSTAKLNIWITNLGDPCTIANDIGAGIPYAWSVAVLHCDGRVLNWSEGRYRLHADDKWTPIPRHTPSGGTPGWWYEQVPTRDGHVEIEVPPGCYVVRGSMHTWFVNGVLHGNWATDHGIVQVCCGDDACVKLYASSFQPCDAIMLRVLSLLVRYKAVGEAEGAAAIRALNALLKPEALSPFERRELEMLGRAFEKMEFPKEPEGSVE